MQLEKLFLKSVDRPIEGVIKADDDVSLYVELDEYIITNEVAKRLYAFFDAYLNYAGANGAWISGFFGSGKSHLLKMLALLLANKPIEDIYPLEVFLEKPQLNDDATLAGHLKKAVNIPSESILFNIDQKADAMTTTELNALIAVFVKVFDEHCGYYGKKAFIAQFERELDMDDQLHAFENAFLEESGMEWKQGRQRVNRLASAIDCAYKKVTGQEASNILDKYRTDYSLSIEELAENVKAYIDTKEPGFRLNFFVDEVGQYIAGNVRLMTNLQTVAESLSTKCKGQSWIIVTAQEDMSSVLGEVGHQDSDDFSRIQARFKNQMKLTSQDVAEVIQLRLLEKREDAVKPLAGLYKQQKNNFKTLFDFADGSQTYKNFRDGDHFLQSYPFIPYQFTLFQASIQNLSRHSAFSGKHSSVGERSMLGVFQEVAIKIKDHQLGELATFDLMYEGIRTALKSGIQQSIARAENNLSSPFAVRVLKALFLVKYVKEFKPTIRNICVLMHDSFERDLGSLKDEIEKALNLLEKETYIQRNGDLYEYLTDEEQDVEAEIKHTDIDSNAVSTELYNLIFDAVIKSRKIRWAENGQDYPFTKRLDGNAMGREYELAIHVVTSFHEHRDAFEKHKTDTVYNDELCVILPESERLVRDLVLYKKAEKYIAHETRATQQDSIKRILSEKNSHNTERYNQLRTLTSKLLGQATFLVKGQALDLAGEDGQSKVIKAFAELITQSYPNLKMLRGQQYSENDIATLLTQGEQGLFGDETQLPEPQQEMFAYIQSSQQAGSRITVKSLLERFERKPYGWSFAAVLCVIAHLCARGKVEVRESTNLLDDADLARALRNTAAHGSLILDPQVEFTPAQVRKLKNFYEEYFDELPHSTEAKALAKEVQQKFATQKQELERLCDQAEKYPFLRGLTEVIQNLDDLASHDYGWFLTALPREADSWLDIKDDLIGPIKSFMTGTHKTIFDDAQTLLAAQKENLSYIMDCPEKDAINAALHNPDIFKGSTIQDLRSSVSSLQGKLDTLVDEEKTAASTSIDALKQKLTGYEQYIKLSSDQMAELASAFATVKSEIAEAVLIAVIRERVRGFDDNEFQRLVDKLLAWTGPTPKIPEPTETPEGTPTSAPPATSSTIAAKDITVSFNKPELATEDDVDSYLEDYRSALLVEIKSGKKVRV